MSYFHSQTWKPVFKKDRSLFAIGGPWNAAIDGGDPSVDCSCLIRTAIRYAVIKQGMMTNCQLYCFLGLYCFAQW